MHNLYFWENSQGRVVILSHDHDNRTWVFGLRCACQGSTDLLHVGWIYNGARSNENSHNDITESMECGENSCRIKWSRTSPPKEKFMIDLAKENFIFLPASTRRIILCCWRVCLTRFTLSSFNILQCDYPSNAHECRILNFVINFLY